LALGRFLGGCLNARLNPQTGAGNLVRFAFRGEKMESFKPFFSRSHQRKIHTSALPVVVLFNLFFWCGAQIARSEGPVTIKGGQAACSNEPVNVVNAHAPASVAAVGGPVIGPDVIVGSLHQVANYGHSGGISAFAIGTYSCNIGDYWLNWFANTNQHPVIGQNVFRLKDGRFEQIGQSWLKHGFFALSNTLCNTGCEPTDGDHLGVHCADPYSAALNGTQHNLGPKWQVNAHTGDFPYPPSNPGWSGIIARRLQVRNSDLDPSQNGGGQYFIEGQYIAADDAAWGNQNNNASYRPVTVSTDGQTWFIELAGTTRRGQPAIRAWNEVDATVRETDVQVPGEGLFILAAKATDLGSGWWNYEYALQNLNSHRSAQSFSIPFDPSASVQNIGFRDVHYHSGEPFSTLDWSAVISNGVITWATQDYASNPNANALRWGTLYNFRFDINRQPQTSTATLGLFRPGTPGSVTGGTLGPILSPADCNANGVPDSIDIAKGTSVDCDADLIPDECESFEPASYRIAEGLQQPAAVAHAGDSRLFIVEPTGRIRIWSNGSVLATAFLDLSGLVSGQPDKGLHSVAFDPQYASNGRFYVAYTDVNGLLVIARYQVSGNPHMADPNSGVVLKTIGPASIVRSGGHVAFGPDGYLYAGVGDGGGVNDPLNHGQDPSSLRGKLLRLDVNSPPDYIPEDNPFAEPGLPLDEIWAMGLHDPRNFSFDSATGDLYIADRGHAVQDEVNVQPPGPGGQNYGWRCMEGALCTGLSGCTCNSPAVTAPQFTHTRSGSDCGIVGGVVYRGCSLPNMLGAYFYGDQCSGTVRSFRLDNGVATDHRDWTTHLQPSEGTLGQILAMGEDADGELHFVDAHGVLYRIVPQIGTDCGNGTLDPGEECDDGNNEPGDGCDAFCRTEPGPANDHCFNAASVGEETVAIDTTGALTDGPDELEACLLSEPVFGADVWYCYTASCSGTVTVDLCSSTFDTMAAVYDGCSCPADDSAIACEDGGCFAQSIVSFPATACQSYLIRVGGYFGDEGLGSMTVTCDPDPISADCNLNGVDDSVDIACGTETDTNGNLIPDSCETDGDWIRGGRLYDQWWSQTGATPPATDHPLWTYRPDPVGNPASGAETWRCKECHGWDYKGVLGEYASGPHRTGFGGVLNTSLSAEAMFDLLKEPPSNAGNPGVPNGHDYGTVLPDAAVGDLVAFVLLGTLDTDDLLEPKTRTFLGDPEIGQINYETGGVQSQCMSCHGPQGADINFGTVQNPEYLGTTAVNDPWEFLHRARLGFPGTPMQGWLANGGTDQGAADIGRYAQLTFPTDCVDDSQCGDGIACTLDSCDGAGRCLHLENDKACPDDGFFCNGPEYCDAQQGCINLGNPCSVPSACNESEPNCGCLAPLVEAAGGRYLAITPQFTVADVPMAFRIKAVCDQSTARYLGTPSSPYNVANTVDDPLQAAWLTPAQWGSTIYVTGFDIAPELIYEVQADCGLPSRPVLTLPATATTHRWGDVVSRTKATGEPDGIVDFTDVSALVDGFRALPTAQPLYRLDLFGCLPNQVIDFIDISGGVDAFRGVQYEDSLCPGPCW
jgi:hypothetical protein